MCYQKIKSLREISEFVTNKDANSPSYIEVDGSRMNAMFQYQIDVSMLKPAIAEVTQEAEEWRAPKCPESLYMNHGEYINDLGYKIKGGLDHIIAELLFKETSNRALYSLISQKDISGSGDDPIPSFMTFQTSIKNSELYCTIYFRALEVGTFLPINLEEIRLNLLEICDKISRIASVKLTLFAFRAYHKEKFNPLRKAKLDQMSYKEITKQLKEHPAEFEQLLIEKAKNSTVIRVEKLNELQKAINKSKTLKKQTLYGRFQLCIHKAIKAANSLHDIRKNRSHHEKIDSLNKEYQDNLNELAEGLGRCL